MYYFIGTIIILRLYYILFPVNNLLKYFFINIIHSLIISIYTYPVILEILNTRFIYSKRRRTDFTLKYEDKSTSYF